MTADSSAIQSIGLLAGGLGLFLFGLRNAGEGLPRAAGGKLRALLGILTRNRPAAAAAGAGATVLVQSSGAVTVMLVGFAQAGMINCTQAMPVLLGSDFGTTLTVQALAFPLETYALLAVAVGAIPYFFLKRGVGPYIGQAVAGFGMIFFAMGLLKSGAKPLGESAYVMDALQTFARYPVLGAVAGMALAAVLHSAPTIALAMAMTAEGRMPPVAAVAIVIGANVGTTATGLLAAVGGSGEARRVAWSNVLFKLAGAIPALMLVGLITRALTVLDQWVSGESAESSARFVAMAHTIFNAAMLVVFLPLTGFTGRLLKRWITDRSGETEGLASALVADGPPASALRAARCETARLIRSVSTLVRISSEALVNNQFEARTRLADTFEALDTRHRALTAHLVKLLSRPLTPDDAERARRLLALLQNIDQAAAACGRDLGVLANRMAREDVAFSMQGAAELRKFSNEAASALEAVAGEVERDADNDGAQPARSETLRNIRDHARTLDEDVRAVSARYLESVSRGVRDAERSTGYFLGALDRYRGVYEQAVRIAGTFSDDARDR